MQLNIHGMAVSINTLSNLLITYEETIPKYSEGKNVSVVFGIPLLCSKEGKRKSLKSRIEK